MTQLELAVGVLPDRGLSVLSLRSERLISPLVKTALQELVESDDCRVVDDAFEINIGETSKYHRADCRKDVMTLLESNNLEVINRNFVLLDNNEPVFEHIKKYAD